MPRSGGLERAVERVVGQNQVRAPELVQPRPETPSYTARRTEGFDKYRKGVTTTTDYPEVDKAKLSDTGK